MFGEESHLKQQCLAKLSQLVLGTGPDAAVGLVKFPGKEVELKAVKTELQTVGMFASSRLVVVEDADDFVTKFREGLEAYCLKPASRSVLVLDCKSWKSNTVWPRRSPRAGSNSTAENSQPGPAEVARRSGRSGVSETAQSRRSFLMVELAGTGLGQLSQELGKLVSYVGDRPQIKPDDVRQLVGGWKAKRPGR